MLAPAICRPTIQAFVALALGLASAESRAERVWIAARNAEQLSPWMIRSATVNLDDDGAPGGFLVPIIAIEKPADEMESSATFTVTVPRAGTYRLWAHVKFPGGGDEAFDVVAQEKLLGVWSNEPPERDWKWRALSIAQTLSAGRWQFRVRAHRAAATVYAPLKWRQAEPTFNPRLDALCLTDEADYTPTDNDARRALGSRSTSAKLFRMETTPLPQVTPIAGRKSLPDWMRVPRWFTKDSWRDELAHRHAGDIRQLVRQVAANGGQALRLSCYWGGETFFQSRVAPHAPGLGELDYLREAVEEGARCGVKIVVYMNPNALYAGHPLFEDCIAREADGSISTRRAYGGDRGDVRYVCINHPRYRQFLRDLLTEIFARYKADGLYVDGLTPQRCFCEHCRRKYQAMFGEPMPAAKLAQIRTGWAVWGEFGSDPQPIGDVENDVDARRWTEMLYQTFGEITREFSQTVKAAKPDAMTAFHSHPKPNCAEFYDATLTEVYSPRPWVHTAWRAGEMAGYSSVFRVPLLFNIYPHRHYTEREARRLAFQGLANGAYPNFWSTPGMKPVFDFVARNTAYLDFATTAAVKFLALPRDLQASQTQLTAPRVPRDNYKQDRFLAPYVGAYSALMRSGLPIVTLHRPHFEESLQGFRVLCLANVALMSDAQAEAVRRFVREGGGLLATHETSLYDEKGRRREDFALADVLGVHYGGVLPAAPRVIQFAKHPTGEGLADNLAHTEPCVSTKLTTASAAAWLTGADVSPQTTPAVVVHSFGKGRVVYLPGRLDAAQCVELSAATERLFANAVRWLVDDAVPVRVEASGVVGVSLYQQPRRYLVHLVNHQRDSLDRTEDLQPIAGAVIHVRVPPRARVSSVGALWSGKQLSHEQHGDIVSVRLPVLDEYEMLAIEWR